MLKSKVQNQLHELIKSLSQTEKRYFKIIAQIQTQKKTCDYVLLFDVIDKQTEFNEDKIKAIFKGTPIEKRYASLKKYLYELILKSLSIYHFETKPSVKVRRMIDMAEILMTKGLYQQAKRRLEKTEKLAEEAGMIFILHDVRRLKFECTQAIGVSFGRNEFEDFERTQNELTDELNVFNALYNQEMSPMKESNIAKIEKTVDKEFDKLLLHSEHSICYTPTLHQAYSSAKSFYVETKNWAKMAAVSKQHFNEFKSKEFSISNWTEAYFTCLKDYILYCDISNPATVIEKARTLLNEKGIGFINHNECIANTYIAELFYELKENTISKVNLEEIEQFLNQYGMY